MAIAPNETELTSVRLTVEGRGTITVELDGENAPITVGNFLDLVQRGFYDGITFHRVVDDFVAQAGDPNSKDPDFPTNLLGREGFTDPDTGQERTIPLEIKPEGADEPPVLRNDRGTIAMSRGSDPNSASSQFYFNLVNSRFLDGNYAVFGRITDGLSVMDDIEIGDRIESAIVFEPEVEPESPPLEPEPEPNLRPSGKWASVPGEFWVGDVPAQVWKLPPGDRIPTLRSLFTSLR